MKNKILKSGIGIGATLLATFILTTNANALEATPDKCFVIKGTEVISYQCYDGNDKGYETITDVVIPNNITKIDNSAFSNKNLTSAIIPNSVTEIDDHAFKNNSLTNITIPNSVTKIGYMAFSDNELTGLTIPKSVTQIGKLAFANNNINTVYNLSDINNKILEDNYGIILNYSDNSHNLIFGRNCETHDGSSACEEKYTLTIINDKNPEDNTPSDDIPTTKPEDKIETV